MKWSSSVSSATSSTVWLSSPRYYTAYATLCILYSRKIWRFGGLYYNHQSQISYSHIYVWWSHTEPPNLICQYSCNSDLGLTAKFNSRQYFRLYVNTTIWTHKRINWTHFGLANELIKWIMAFQMHVLCGFRWKLFIRQFWCHVPMLSFFTFPQGKAAWLYIQV